MKRDSQFSNMAILFLMFSFFQIEAGLILSQKKKYWRIYTKSVIILSRLHVHTIGTKLLLVWQYRGDWLALLWQDPHPPLRVQWCITV